MTGASIKSGPVIKTFNSQMLKTNTFNWAHMNNNEQKAKWNLMLDRQDKGKCIVCGKVLPPTFGTMEAITKFNLRHKVTLSFCVPCMDT